MAISENLQRTPKAQRWGNSLAVRLPAGLLANSHISEGTALEISQKDDGLFIRAIPEKNKTVKYANPYSEALILEGLTAETAHADEVFAPLSSEIDN
ncbi:MAG: AbrB/MazE/SpoVT family DNA-binding domain-containing protein [Oceanospirillaceae bacterium]